MGNQLRLQEEKWFENGAVSDPELKFAPTQKESSVSAPSLSLRKWVWLGWAAGYEGGGWDFCPWGCPALQTLPCHINPNFQPIADFLCMLMFFQTPFKGNKHRLMKALLTDTSYKSAGWSFWTLSFVTCCVFSFFLFCFYCCCRHKTDQFPITFCDLCMGCDPMRKRCWSTDNCKLEKDEVTQMPALIYHQAFQEPFVNLLCSAVTNQTTLICLFTLMQCFTLYFNYASHFPYIIIIMKEFCTLVAVP